MTFDPPPLAVVSLSDDERRVLARWHPELGGYASAVVIVSSDDVHPDVAALISLLRDRINGNARAGFEETVERLLAETPPLASQEPARREAQFRLRAVEQYGAYSCRELANLHGSNARNRYTLAASWRSAGRIFGVPYQGRTVFLGFQFDTDARPLPVIRDVLRSLSGWSGWDVAGWFLRPNGLLDNRLPVELLASYPHRLAGAAVVDGRQGLSPLRRSPRRRAVRSAG